MFYKILFLLSLLLPLIFAHLDRRQDDEQCSCPGDSPQFAPIPQQAIGVNVSLGTADYETECLGGGAYVVYSGSHQALFLVSDEGVIVVDCPPSLDLNLKYAIGNVTDQPVRKVIYSHAHNDHIGSASIFNSNSSGNSVDFIAHAETAVLLEAVPGGDTGRPTPTETFAKNTTVHLGNQTVELAYFGPNHQPGNVFIYVPSSKILMLIDIIFPGWAPFFNLALAEFVPGYVQAHDISLQYDFEVFVGGHFNRVGNRKDVELAREYVYDLLDSCREVLDDTNINFTDEIASAFEQNPNNFYAALGPFTNLPAELCAQPVINKWLGILAGVDVVTISHATRMIQGLRIEYGEFDVIPFTRKSR